MVMQMETKSDHGVFVVVTAIPRFVWLASVTLTEGGARDVRAGRRRAAAALSEKPWGGAVLAMNRTLSDYAPT